MNRKQLKEDAKKKLEGNYKHAIIILIVTSLLINSIGSISETIIGFLAKNETIASSMNIIISLLVEGLIMFGYHSYFLKISRNQETTSNEIFSKTNMFWSYIAITILIGIFVGLWSLLLIIPGIIASLSYSQSLYIALDNPELDAMSVLKESKKMMEGHKMELFELNLSFLGWDILSILTLGILSYWVTPYKQVTLANYYNELKKSKTVE